MTRSSFADNERCTVLWINGLTFASIAFSMVIVFILVFVAPSISWLMASLLIRGTVVIFWVCGFVQILCGVVYLRAKSYVGTSR
jgi:hypothetical protein